MRPRSAAKGRFPPIDFLGNISLKVVGTLCTIGVLAASYFFIVKPTLDTTGDAIESVSGPLQEAQKQAKQAAQSQQQPKGQGGQGGAGQIDLGGLQRCVQRAGQDVNALQRCTAKFAP